MATGVVCLILQRLYGHVILPLEDRYFDHWEWIHCYKTKAGNIPPVYSYLLICNETKDLV